MSGADPACDADRELPATLVTALGRACGRFEAQFGSPIRMKPAQW
jgi:hypothetical protein